MAPHANRCRKGAGPPVLAADVRFLSSPLGAAPSDAMGGSRLWQRLRQFAVELSGDRARWRWSECRRKSYRLDELAG